MRGESSTFRQALAVYSLEACLHKTQPNAPSRKYQPTNLFRRMDPPPPDGGQFTGQKIVSKRGHYAAIQILVLANLFLLNGPRNQ